MEIVKLILTVFLIAAINTLIVMAAVSVIFRIKNKKEDKGKELLVNSIAIPVNESVVANQQEEKTQEDMNSSVEKSLEETENIKEDAKELKPKFLKYTSKGYIIPEKDIVEKLKWR